MSDHDDESTTESDMKTRYSRISALFFMSMVMGWDLLFELFCARLPLLFYLIAGGLGYAIGKRYVGWLSGGGWGRRALRRLAIVGCVMGLLGAVALTFLQPPWSAHCGFRYCGRAMGMGLTRSPFPVGTVSCQNLHKCANEYQYTESEWSDLLALMEESGCEPP